MSSRAEAVAPRQRFSVHRVDDEGSAAVQSDLVGKPAVNPSTDRPTICVAPACTPARSSTAASGTPCHRVADEVSSDLVGHALQCHDVLDALQREQLVVDERVRPVDHALDLQLPGPDVDLRRRERRVDAVEVGGRGDVRRQPGDRRCPGRRWHGRRRRRAAGRCDAAASTTSVVPMRRPSTAAPTAPAASTPAVTTNVRRVDPPDVEVSGGVAASAPRQAQQSDERRDAGDDCAHRGNDRRRELALGVLGERVQPDESEGDEPHDADPQPSRAARPMTAPTINDTTQIPITRAVLSFVPNSATARSLSDAAKRSMNWVPTASTSVGPEPARPDTS